MTLHDLRQACTDRFSTCEQGLAFDDRIVFGTQSFEDNPDFNDPIYSTKFGIYTPGCGMDNVMLSWGHDEYLYHIVKDQSTLPKEALAMIRYHSFYPWHSAGAYRELMDEHDEDMLRAVKAFNPYDLYSKSDEAPKVEELKVSNAQLNPLRSKVWTLADKASRSHTTSSSSTSISQTKSSVGRYLDRFMDVINTPW